MNWIRTLIMKSAFKSIDKAKISGRKIKIPCRNSYDRKQVYEYANEKGVKCRSIIEYTQIYVNQKIIDIYDSKCCFECDGITVEFYGTPYSFVEINSKSDEKEIIGNPESLPAPQTTTFYGNFTYEMKKYRREFKDRLLI